jgi:hypothetical protein
MKVKLTGIATPRESLFSGGALGSVGDDFFGRRGPKRHTRISINDVLRLNTIGIHIDFDVVQKLETGKSK